MILRRRGYLQPNTESGSRPGEALEEDESSPLFLKREPGQVGWTMGLFFLLFLGILLCASLQLELYRTTSLYLEDALAASNLASAVVDLEEYGMTHRILIQDPQEAYERYRQAVKGNLNLSDDWEGQKGGVVQGAVRVMQYIVYNVKGNVVSVYQFDESGQMTLLQETLGSVSAPNGISIESTSVYSEIAYTVKGFLGIQVEARKGHLADVVR